MSTDDGTGTMTEPGANPRVLRFETCFNVRDLGGLPTADGRRTRWGTLFRADSPHRLRDDELARLHGLGLRTVVDLRSDAEVARTGHCLVGEACRLVHLPIVDDAAGPDRRPSAFAGASLGEIYVHMVSSCAGSLAAAVTALAAPTARPALFHCTSGKDRTGILAALLLDLVGVADADIATDYTLTGAARPRRDAWLAEHDPEGAAFFANLPPQVTDLRAESILDALAHVRRAHGSTRAFLVAAGVDALTLDHLATSLVD